MAGNLKCNGKIPLVMGIINCTPDSFYGGSRKSVLKDAVSSACRMAADGADILDIGGESSRPGAEYVDAREETQRVVPIIEAIREKLPDITISIDTRKASVAEAALKAGADIINDISGFHDDPALADVAAAWKVPVILMHMKGSPKNMQDDPGYTNTIEEIKRDLDRSIQIALQAGVEKGNIIIDPGIGFGKRLYDNLLIVKEVQSFRDMGYPVLIGHSRKSFIGQILDTDVENRLTGSVTVGVLAALRGASILRVHDVLETVQSLKMVQAIMEPEVFCKPVKQ